MFSRSFWAALAIVNLALAFFQPLSFFTLLNLGAFLISTYAVFEKA